jgi:hypothetical protein
MKEAEDVALRRKTCAEISELLGRALEIMKYVRDFDTFKYKCKAYIELPIHM